MSKKIPAMPRQDETHDDWWVVRNNLGYLLGADGTVPEGQKMSKTDRDCRKCEHFHNVIHWPRMELMDRGADIHCSVHGDLLVNFTAWAAECDDYKPAWFVGDEQVWLAMDEK